MHIIALGVGVIIYGIASMLFGLLNGLFIAYQHILPLSFKVASICLTMSHLFFECVSALLAGYVAGRLAKQKQLQHGIILSVLCVLLQMANVAYFSTVLANYPNPINILNLLLIILIMAYGTLGSFLSKHKQT